MAQKSSLKITRRGLLRAATHTGIAAAASSLAGLKYAEAVEPEELDFAHHTLRLPRLDPAFNGYRLIQISDLHFDGLPGNAQFGDGWMTGPRLKHIVGRINALRPDAVVITGDIVSNWAEPFAASLVEALSELQPAEATFAILGNHDYWQGPDTVRDILRRAGATVLTNAAHTLHRGAAMLHIAGLDDAWVGHPDLPAVTAALPPQGAAILLVHEPDFADTTVKTGRFDLQLSGHSHGGQVCLPGGKPLHVPQMAEKYPTGLYHIEAETGEKMLQYTNRGLGMVRPYVRLFCKPEVTVFTLEAKKEV